MKVMNNYCKINKIGSSFRLGKSFVKGKLNANQDLGFEKKLWYKSVKSGENSSSSLV